MIFCMMNFLYTFSGSIKNSDTEKVGIRLTLFSLKLLAGFYNYYYADFLLLRHPLHSPPPVSRAPRDYTPPLAPSGLPRRGGTTPVAKVPRCGFNRSADTHSSRWPSRSSTVFSLLLNTS